jgi:adenine phosphoribosyltransferase
MENNYHVDPKEVQLLKDGIRKIPNFPKKDILFYDLFSNLINVEMRDKLFDISERMVKNFMQTTGKEINCIVGLESRGFLIGLVLADRLKLPFVPIRKKNKLPGSVYKINYITEYSEDTFELQVGSLVEGSKCLLVDDLLATGGSLRAAEELIEMAKAEIVSYYVAFEIISLKGRDKLKDPNSLISIINID